MGLFDFFKPKYKHFNIEKYSLNDIDKIMKDLMASPEGSNLFFRTYELLGHDPTDINIRNNQSLRQKVGQTFTEIVRYATLAKLSPPPLSIALIPQLEFHITSKCCCTIQILELYLAYVKQLFKISR